MILNHNISALNTYNKFNNANKNKCKAMEKISSGINVNRAGDNSAGLAISEKMRMQIRGLEQASRSIQDGVSLIQTAEGGLGEISNPNLQRMRELCLQAANGTLTSEDKQKIQLEINEIKNGIDDIANNTEFNTIKVLRPPILETPPITIAGKTDIVFVVDVSGSMGSTIDNVISNLDSFIATLSGNGVDFNLGLVSYSDVTNGEPLTKWNFTNNITTFKNNMTTMRSNMLGGGDLNESGLEGIKDSANGALSFPLRSDSSKQFILITDAPVHDNNIDGDGGDGLSSYDIDDVGIELATKNIKLTVVGPISGTTNTQLKRLSDPTNGSYLNIYGDFSTQLINLANNIVIDSGITIEKDEMPTLTLQVGPNAKEEFLIKLFDARTSNLGVADVIIDPFEEAEKSLSKIDAAIEKVSSQRAKFGAYQNALEHVHNNVLNYKENITAAESRIRDADIAKEIMKVTKYSILEQSSMALLKQSEDMQQGVLNLLKKWE